MHTEMKVADSGDSAEHRNWTIYVFGTFVCWKTTVVENRSIQKWWASGQGVPSFDSNQTKLMTNKNAADEFSGDEFAWVLQLANGELANHKLASRKLALEIGVVSVSLIMNFKPSLMWISYEVIYEPYEHIRRTLKFIIMKKFKHEVAMIVL